MAVLFFMALLLGMTDYSSSSYCVCNQGYSDAVLQKDIDYACGAGADCSAILQSGSCYQPNTVKSHCDYAVNNYYQKMNQITGSCNFSGTATVTNTLPTTVVSGCTYPASASEVSSSTPTSSTGSTTSTTGSTTYISPTGSESRGYTIHSKSMSVTLMTLFSSGLLALWLCRLVLFSSL